jgi:hypothetical protein
MVKILLKFPLLLVVTILILTACNRTLEAPEAAETPAENWDISKYYIDSQNGDDNNDGLSENTAWKSHTMVSSVTFQPGDTIAFKRGSQFTGPIHITESGTEDNPITITAYGEGEPPRFTNSNSFDMNGNAIRISGSWIILEKLYFHDTPPTKNANRVYSIFMMGAVLNMEGANHNIIRNNVFVNCTKAIQSTGEFTLITYNYMNGPNHALWIRPGADGAWGPMGIQLGIGNQEVSYNIIKNYLTTDSPYGSDGGAIELDDGRFHKDNFYIHHNYTEGNAGFIESSWEFDNNPFVQEVHNLRVAFNVSYDAQDWLYLWAPCHDCYFDNNTVIRTHDFSSPLNDVVWVDFDGVNFRNNLIVYSSEVYQGEGANGILTENNWYLNVNNWSQSPWDPKQAGSGDPGLVDLAGGDYRLTNTSSLIGKGTNLGEFYSGDFEGNVLSENGTWDIGAFQGGVDIGAVKARGSTIVISPNVGEIFYVPANITINAEATISEGSITKVEFYEGSSKLGEDLSSPYSYNWNIDQVGTYQLGVTAVVDDGTRITSSPIWVLVTDSYNSEEIIWNSYDVVMDTEFQPVIAMDQNGTTPAVLEFYESITDGKVDQWNLFGTFQSGQHTEAFNKVENVWVKSGGLIAYPYVGKSTVGRGADDGENNAPMPTGVRDLQMHPSDNDRLVVAAFVVPFDGDYSLSNLGVRRVHNEGGSVGYKVFNGSKKLITGLTATSNQLWVVDDSVYDLGRMQAGDRIYFSVDRGRNDDFAWDAAEVSWTITFTNGTSVGP